MTHLWRALLGRIKSRKGMVAGGVVTAVVLMAAGGSAVYAANDDSGRYRTAVAELGSVAQTLALTGQVASASSVAAAFQVAGTVAEVRATLGQQVTAGQALATLDPTDLQTAVTSAQDTLARAQEKLTEDLAAQSSGGGSSGGGGSGGVGTGGGAQDPAVTAARQAVVDAQAALLAQLDAVTQAQDAASAGLDDAQQTCAPVLDPSGPTPQPSTSASPTPPTSPAPEPSTSESGTMAAGLSGNHHHDDGDHGSDTPSLAACQQALLDSLTLQQATTTAQQELTTRAGALDRAVTALVQALSGGGGAPAAGLAQTSTQSSAQSTVRAGSTGATVTAEQVVADRADIDLANAKLALAQQDLALATLASPIDGTVVAIALKVGDAVTVGSTTSIITVQGSGYVVDVTVPLAKIGKLAVGQTAQVELPAFAVTYPATVSAIGVLNVSQTSTPAYTVTLAIDPGDDQPRIGVTAQATIALASADSVLTVPTSAVTQTATGATVTVLRDGKPETVPVQVGVVGAERTEIASGLSVGDVVVVADLDAPISSDTSTGTTGRRTGFGGTVTFGGTGFGGTGLGGTGFGGTGRR